jgi:hypothetical protein
MEKMEKDNHTAYNKGSRNSAANRGKEFESVVQFALRQIDGLYWHKTKPYYNGFGAKPHPEKGLLDYLCCYDGAMIMFDAKSTESNVYLTNWVKPHQIQMAEKIQRAEGLSFFLIWFSKLDLCFAVDDFDLIKSNTKLTVEALREKAYEIKCSREGGRPVIDLKTYVNEMLPADQYFTVKHHDL